MDLPGKDAARSKWRSSQRHKSGPSARPGSSQSGKPPKASLDSNFDRYEEEEVDTRAGQARRSAGEDLTTLLRDAEGSQLAARRRAKVSAEPEIELLAHALDGAIPQGLRLDTDALAKALSFIPLHELLGLDPKGCNQCNQ
ncbi:hypothetical protein WJX84_010081 [Apatococcus fuscideae]|uniref:Uncharacterized protein n=1 Tax=Apatococcus fuscideae TaxID=2026836 RepID=A0AAW1SSE3_9CHLO